MKKTGDPAKRAEGISRAGAKMYMGKAGKPLNDDELDQVSGGCDEAYVA